MEEFTGERLNVCVDCIKKFRQISEEDSSMVRTIVDDLISSCNNEKTLPILKKYKVTWVITSEADTLDEPPYANLFIDDSSNDYDYSINQIDTKEITVQDKNRELQKALVNTEVTFKKQADYDDDEYTALNERPG